MALNDAVPSSATDVFKRNIEDTDRLLNTTDNVVNRVGTTLESFPNATSRVSDAADAAQIAIQADVDNVDASRISAQSAITSDSDSVEASRIAAELEIANDVSQVNDSEIAAQASIQSDVDSVDASRILAEQTIQDDVDAAKAAAIANYQQWNSRGNWASATAYLVGDIWQNTATSTWYLVLNDYTSGATVNDDITGPNVTVLQGAGIQSFEGLSEAITKITANPELFSDNSSVSISSNKTKAECVSAGVDFPDGNGGDYVITIGETLVDGRVIAAGTKQLKLITQKLDLPIENVTALRLLEPAVDGQQFNLLEYHAGTGLGGGTLYYDATDTTSVDDGIEVFVTSSGARIKRAGAELKTLDNAGSAQHSKNAKNRSGVGVSNERTHIIAGIDSLTQGYFTGDDFGYGPVHSHFSEFIKLATNTLGNSGGYFSIVSEQSARFGAEIGAGSGFTSLKGIDASDMRRRMSFDFNGLAYSSAKWVPNKSIYWTSNRNWNKQRLFFLRQFNGGTFEVDHISEVSYRYSIDTGKASAGLGLGDSATDLLSGEYELDYIDIDRLAGASDQMKLRYVADGEICVYGVFTDDLKGNCKYTYQSNSGYKVADYVSELDGTTLERWYQILEPSHYMLNGGTNDRKSSTVSEFEVNYAELIRRIMAGSAAGSNSITSDILCISPNDLSDKGLIREFRKSIYSIATNNGYGYLDHMQVLGTFEDADTLGLMRDGTHPGYAGIPPLALADCSYFGISAGKYAFADSYQAGTGELFEFSGELRSVATGQITAGNSVEIYNIGLRDVTDFITFNLSVTGQRTGQDLFRNKSLDFSIRNSGVGTPNEVTFLLAGTATETLGNTTAIDFTISTAIVSDRLVISINCTGNIQNFSARANWFGRAYYVGDVVFENDVSDLSLVTYSGESDD